MGVERDDQMTELVEYGKYAGEESKVVKVELNAIRKQRRETSEAIVALGVEKVKEELRAIEDVNAWYTD